MKYTHHPVRVMDFRGTYKGGGGPDKTILNSAALHDPSRVNVLVAYLRDPRDTEYSIDIWARHLSIQYIDVPDKRMIDFQCLAKLIQLIDTHNIQLVHSHDDKTLLYGWLLRMARPGLKIMFTCHLYSAYTRSDFKSIKRYLSFLIRKKTLIHLMKRYQKPILSVSKHTKQTLVGDGIKAQDIEVLHNGIDTELWRKDHGRTILKQELAIPENALLVGTVARIAQKHKDLPTFYRVAAQVNKKMPHVRFVIVGDGHGKLLGDAKKRVSDLGLNDVIHFTGHRTDLLNIYASLDLFLMTSRTEGLPNTVLEAMAMEVPVVSTRVAGVPELIDDKECGLLCPIGNVDELAGCVCRLLDDADARNTIANKARQRVENAFSFKNRVLSMEDYYEKFSDIKRL